MLKPSVNTVFHALPYICFLVRKQAENSCSSVLNDHGALAPTDPGAPLTSGPTLTLLREWMMLPYIFITPTLTWTGLGAQWGLCFWISLVCSIPLTCTAGKEPKNMQVDSRIISWFHAVFCSTGQSSPPSSCRIPYTSGTTHTCAIFRSSQMTGNIRVPESRGHVLAKSSPAQDQPKIHRCSTTVQH